MAGFNSSNAKRAYYFSSLGYYFSVGYFALKNFRVVPKAVSCGNVG